jgi:nicotinamidase-related amidase/type 1 glutamine amidotransferase
MRASASGKLNRRRLLLAMACLLASLNALTDAGSPALHLHARSRQPAGADVKSATIVESEVTWDARKTAIIVCDMWDRHWCRGATARVAEMAPRMNAVLRAARERGALIVHAPSETMPFYANWPQRLRAQQAPKAAAPTDVSQWQALNHGQEPPLPIDDADGGCDDDPPCPQGNPWRRQIAALEIAPADVISDRGDEIVNVFAQAGIENVIIMGVHANMCVLGRPFSIRQMVKLGKHVVLMRDLTDSMYNSRRPPFVRHFAGTDLVIAHIEANWCPSITSADFLGGEPFCFAADRRPTVAFLIGENEYRTWETLPRFAREELAWRGFNPVFVTASTNVSDGNFTNVAALEHADLIVVSARRRAPRREVIAAIHGHLAAGRPIVGIRTASHAFAGTLPATEAAAFAVWPEFDAEVLGGNYHNHAEASAATRVQVATNAATHPILTGVAVAQLVGHGTLYRTTPLKPDVLELLSGLIPNESPEPVAWVRTVGPGQARVFYTSLGHADDFAEPAFRRLLLNGILWGLHQPVPPR